MAVEAEQIRAYVEYLRELGVFDLYRCGTAGSATVAELFGASALETAVSRVASVPVPALAPATPATPSASFEAQRRPVPTSAPSAAVPAVPNVSKDPGAGSRASFATEIDIPKPTSFSDLAPLPGARVAAADRPAALAAIRERIGDCTRCPLAYAGRHAIVFGNGEPTARLMFVGEGPGADEDATGEPFVGKAGQLLNNMIAAMGLAREQVYVANIVKCRPPKNRVPEPVEANTCSQFLLEQMDIVQPQVVVALGSTAAMYLLGVKQSLSSLRGRWHSCRGAKLAITYHPAFLLRDPRQKGEAWKDLQMVMAEMGLKGSAAKSSLKS